MILEPGSKVLVSHRRLFTQEEQRFFVGEVVAYDAGVAKLRGYSFVVDGIRGRVLRKNDSRIKIISLQSGTMFVYQLPDSTVVDDVQFETDEGALVLTDSGQLRMNMTESPRAGRI